MARTLFTLVALAGLAGCSSYDKPRDLREMPRAKLTGLPAEEQEKRIRGRYSIPDDDRRVGPSTGLARNTPLGW